MKSKHTGNVVRLTFSTFYFDRFLMRLVVAMSQANLSYVDIAHRANVGLSTVCRIMSRRSKGMYVGTVARLSQALGVSTDYMLGVREARSARERGIEEEANSLWDFELRRRGAG